MSGVCPRCGAAASGKFCSECGSSLAAVTCPSCGETPPPGARFCNKCGATLGAALPAGAAAAGARGTGTAGGDSPVAWWIAGATLVVLIVVLALPVLNPDEEPEAPPAQAAGPAAPFAGGATGTPPDLSGMSPREMADRLYNRVMMAAESGDEATVQQFLPMALQAHEMAQPLDEDGLYHLATLKRAGGDFAGAIETAESGLADEPDHLLLLAAAGESAEGMGDSAAARRYWQRFLEVFDKQKALGLTEYMDHDGVLQESREHAREVVGG